ncbi:hypothetical protein ACFQ6N_09525 [Kitasatospora sp. NPDC056446]|uniref:hypothetical protein n=1 Tax=Kitasatospora sp. NPDC056446 TaxID=3345819 RepID=UPI00367F4510
MLVDILTAVVEVLGAVGGPAPGDPETDGKKSGDAFAEGQVLVFPGSVTGARPYCRPTAEFLHVSVTALAISPLRASSARAHHLPAGLEVAEVRRWREGDPEAIERHWDVIECRDGEDVVLVGCSTGSARYVLRALQPGDD